MQKIPQYGFNNEGGVSSVTYVDLPTVSSTSVWGDIGGDIQDQSDLQTAFDEYAVSSHTHSTFALSTHAHTEYSVTSHTHPGGSDPWVYLKQNANFSLSTVNWTDIPQLSFPVGTNSTYEFEGTLMMKTAVSTINAMPGFRWPTGTTSVGWINLAQSPTTQIMGFGNQVSTLRMGVGGFPTTTGPWPCIYGGLINTFGASGSSFSLQMRTESSTIFVSSLAGSFLKYRVI